MLFRSRQRDIARTGGRSDFAISVVRHEFRVRIFCESVASRGESRVINPRRIEKRKPLLRAFFFFDTARPGRARFRETFEKKITRVELFV
jgi:hypothetical protein